MSKTVKSTKGDAASTKGSQTIKEVRGHGFKAVILMALYQFANDGKVSGRTGGDVKMRNGRSRAFTVPALVRNSFTAFVRSTFASLSTAFRALSPSQIIAWNNYVVYISNRFGVPSKVNGKMAFIRVNANNINTGQSIVADPPVGLSNPSATILGDLTATIATLSAVYTVNAEGKYTQVWATACLSAGVSRPSQSAFRLIGVHDATASSPANLFTMYNDKFGAPVAGAKLFVQFKAIGDGTGLPSAITQSDIVVS